MTQQAKFEKNKSKNSARLKFPEKNKPNVKNNSVIRRHRGLNKETITWLNKHTCMEVTEPEKIRIYVNTPERTR
jgi:hypothetical protein